MIMVHNLSGEKVMVNVEAIERITRSEGGAVIGFRSGKVLRTRESVNKIMTLIAEV